MELLELPELIRLASLDLLKADQAARDWQYQYDAKVNEIEVAIAFDETLKNDAQRKARRNELLNDSGMVMLRDALHSVQDSRTAKAIQLEFLKNQFQARLKESGEVCSKRCACV
jgi:hypothetical protein